jgi:hypothetical protein
MSIDDTSENANASLDNGMILHILDPLNINNNIGRM